MILTGSLHKLYLRKMSVNSLSGSELLVQAINALDRVKFLCEDDPDRFDQLVEKYLALETPVLTLLSLGTGSMAHLDHLERNKEALSLSWLVLVDCSSFIQSGMKSGTMEDILARLDEALNTFAIPVR